METRKLLVAVLLIVLAMALIIGGTLAWFTAEDDLEAITFEAGTVDIEVTDVNEGEGFNNVNPGDCIAIEVEITNIGSKAVVLRLTGIAASWEDGLDIGVVSLDIGEGSEGDWVLGDEEEGNIVDQEVYYVGEPIATGVLVTLDLLVCFDGEGMGNDYQDKEFELSGTFEAIQASNFAPYHEWNEDLYDGP